MIMVQILLSEVGHVYLSWKARLFTSCPLHSNVTFVSNLSDRSAFSHKFVPSIFTVSFVHIVNSIYYLFLYTGFNHFDYYLIVLNISWSLSVTPTVDPWNHRTEIYVTALLPTRGGTLYIVLHKNHPWRSFIDAVIPSQTCVLQSASSVCRPIQMSPPLAGGGLLHIRVRW